MNDKKKPAHEIRLGRIKAVIWSNGTENGERYNVQLKRLYRLPATVRNNQRRASVRISFARFRLRSSWGPPVAACTSRRSWNGAGNG